jgi:hypothetical protein
MKKKLDAADKIVWVQALLVECPMRSPADDCPLEELRKLPLTTRLKMAKDMSLEKVEEIIEHHKECIHRREA